MAGGSLALALLMLATGTSPEDVVPMNSRNFQIPIQIGPGQRDKIKELILLVSTDQGATWHEAAVVPPDKDAFVFYAPNDGLYWFNICVVDTQGNREPRDVYQSVPRQKVLVDTLKPDLRIVAANRQGDEILVSWAIQEDHPDLASLKLEYRIPDAPSWMWYRADAPKEMSGQARFRFANAGPVLVRMTVMDQAGNLGSDQKELPPRSGADSQPAEAVRPVAAQSDAAPPAPSFPPTSSDNGSRVSSPPYQDAPAPRPSGQAPGSGLAGSAYEHMAPEQPTSMRQNEIRAAPERPLTSAPASPPAYPPTNGYNPDQNNRYQGGAGWPQAPSSGYPQGNGYSGDPGNRNQGGTNWSPATNQVYQQPNTSNGDTGNRYQPNAGSLIPPPTARSYPEGPALPLQLTNNRQVALDYEITKKGPSGIGRIELYLTQDDGQTWQLFKEEHPDPQPPLNVILPGEGVFGLRMVVFSKAGLGGRRPKPGDLPQMRVKVDTTPPVARLDPPQGDPHRHDALLLTWQASDENLAPNPITIQWAEERAGIWQNIVKDTTNTGHFQWILPPKMPVKVYLRLIVRDLAGNVTMEETPESVLIDLQEPEGQLKGIVGSAGRL